MADDETPVCGASHPVRDVTCDRPAGHDGAHMVGDIAYKWGGLDG